MRRKAVNSINVTGNSRLFWCAKILKLPSDPIKKTRWQKKETLFFFLSNSENSQSLNDSTKTEKGHYSWLGWTIHTQKTRWRGRFRSYYRVLKQTKLREVLMNVTAMITQNWLRISEKTEKSMAKSRKKEKPLECEIWWEVSFCSNFAIIYRKEREQCAREGEERYRTFSRAWEQEVLRMEKKESVGCSFTRREENAEKRKRKRKREREKRRVVVCYIEKGTNRREYLSALVLT